MKMPAIAAPAALLAALLASGAARGQQTSLIVALPDKVDAAKYQKLKADLGIVDAKALPSIKSEIWQVPDAEVLAALKEAARNKNVATVDYSGADYRDLFLPVSADTALTPQQQSVLRNVRADKTLGDVQVVRLRVGDASKRVLTSGFGTAEGLPQSGSLLMKMRPGLDVVLSRESIDVANDRQFQWAGRTQSVPGDGVLRDGDATMAVSGDRILGTVRVGTETFTIRPLAGGLHAIAKVEAASFPPDHPPEGEGALTDPSPPAQPDPQADPQADAAMDQATGPAEVAIGVAYTDQVAAELASAGISPDQLANLAIATTNNGFADSKIDARVRLAGVRQLSGAEPVGMKATVDALVARDDGRFDALYGWRKSIKANAVMVLVTQNDGCGRAAGILVPAAQTVAAVNYKCAVDNLSFPHEFGHLLGARHDPDTDPAMLPFAYAHGYRYKDQFRTIMAYGGGSCGKCPRINRWADPTQSFGGVPLGTADINHDARVIAAMMPVYGTYFEQ